MKIPCLILCLGAATWGSLIRPQGTEPLRLVQSIPMPSIKGRIDHLSIDLANRRIFLAALGNNTVEVLGLVQGSRIKSLEGFQEPQGVAYVPEFNQLVVANGEDGVCKFVTADAFRVAHTLRLAGDADNIRYDSEAKQLFIGYGDGAIAIADPASGQLLGDIKLEGHPESFQLEKSGARIFVNVPAGPHVAVIDRRSRTVSKWQLPAARQNYPMALDEEHGRLFAGCRQPACVVVFETGSGKVVANVPIAGDSDDLFYDGVARRIYASCGEGFISVLEQRDPDHYHVIARIPTAPKARTSLFVPALKRLYLAVPKQASHEAELRVYEVQDGGS